MAVTDSRLKTGKLTLGGTGGTGGSEFACQSTNVRLTPTFNDEGDTQETLCGDVLAPSTTATWSLEGTNIQDFDKVASFIEFTWTHNLQNIEFVWQPNAGATKFTGTCQCRAVEVGGDVNTRITTDFSMPINGTPAAVWVVVAADETSTEPGPTEPPPEPEPEPELEKAYA